MEESDVDYHIDEDLEEIFHSDLQNIELGHGDGSHDDIIGDHLPEWLVGVIIVIAMLMLAFFVMVVTSLIKNRKKNRSATYIGTGSSTVCDDLESGKIGHSKESGMKITSFTSVPDPNSDLSLPQSSADPNDHDRLTSGGAGDVTGAQGCKNPLFVDDELESDENNEDKENKSTTKTDSQSHDINIPSTSNGISATDSAEHHGKTKCLQHKYKQTCNGKKNSIKSESIENDKPSLANDNDARKRMFASKGKSGNQTSSKRDKSKTASTSDVTSSDGESNKSPGETRECSEEEQTTKSSLDVKDKDTSACCEDSGIELGSTDSHLKDEISGGSETDDMAGLVTKTSYGVCLTGGSGQLVDTDRSTDVKSSNASPSMTGGSGDDSHSSCDTEKGGFFHTPVSQTSSLGCSLENLTLAVGGTSGAKADGDPHLLESISRSVELKLQSAGEDKVITWEATADKELNLPPTSDGQGHEVALVSSHPCSSDSIRTKEVSPVLTETSVADSGFSAEKSGPVNCSSVPADKLLNIHEYDSNIDCDKLLSTNL